MLWGVGSRGSAVVSTCMQGRSSARGRGRERLHARQVLSMHSTYRLMSREREHDQIGIEPMDDVARVGLVPAGRGGAVVSTCMRAHG